MPMWSRAQQGYMFSQHPKIAKKMADRMKGKMINGQRRSTKHPLKGLPAYSKNKRGVKGKRLPRSRRHR